MIPYKTEDWIKCEIYRRLVNDGYEVYPEVSYQTTLQSFRKKPRKDGKERKPQKIRVDLSVYKNGQFKCLIEIKKGNCTKANENGRQYKKYQSLNMDFIYCINEREIEKTIEAVKIL